MSRWSTVTQSIIFSFAITSPSFAYSDQEVAVWVERTLTTTLYAPYLNTVSGLASVRGNYMHNAWMPIESYLDKETKTMHQRHIILHPQPAGPASVSEINDCPGARCWEVTQDFIIPETQNTVSFRLIVMTAEPHYPSPFIIRNLTAVWQ